jgi:hypothetical protein
VERGFGVWARIGIKKRFEDDYPRCRQALNRESHQLCKSKLTLLGLLEFVSSADICRSALMEFVYKRSPGIKARIAYDMQTDYRLSTVWLADTDIPLHPEMPPISGSGC